MVGSWDADERPSEVDRSCSLRRLSISRDIRVDATLVAVQVSDVVLFSEKLRMQAYVEENIIIEPFCCTLTSIELWSRDRSTRLTMPMMVANLCKPSQSDVLYMRNEQVVMHTWSTCYLNGTQIQFETFSEIECVYRQEIFCTQVKDLIDGGSRIVSIAECEISSKGRLMSYRPRRGTRPKSKLGHSFWSY